MSASADMTMPGPAGRTRTVVAPAKPGPAISGPATGIRGAGLAGAVALVILVGVLGGWAASAVISGAVVAPGQTVVEGRSKIVQHQGGGIVASIAVRNGDVVEAGDLLVPDVLGPLKLRRAVGRQQCARNLACTAARAGRSGCQSSAVGSVNARFDHDSWLA